MLSFKVTGRVEAAARRSRIDRAERRGDRAPDADRLRASPAPGRCRLATGPRAARPRSDRRSDTVDADQTALVRQARAALDEARRQRERVATFVSAASPRRRISKPPTPRSKSPKAATRTRSRKSAIARRCSRSGDPKWRSPASSWTTRRCARRSTASCASATCSPASIAPRARRSSPSSGSIRCGCSWRCPNAPPTTLRVGQPVRVTVEGDPTVYEGRVARLSPAIAEGNRTLPIEAEVPNVDGKLRPGTFANADIVTDEKPGARRPADRRSSSSPASRRCWSSRTARCTNSACAPGCASATASRSSRASRPATW